MLKKTITYEDLDGNQITEDFYFNLTKAEIAEKQLSTPGGWGEQLEILVESQNGAELIAAFKEFLLASYGRRSEDGKRFIKSPQISEEFTQTGAYDQLFIEMMTNAGAAAQFVEGVMPKDLLEAAKNGEQLFPELNTPPETAKDETPAYIREDREPTNQELAAMSPDELRQAFKYRQQKRQAD